MELSRAVAGFLGDLAVSRSPSTAEAYRYALARFTEFLEARGRLPADVGGMNVGQALDFARWVLAVPGSSRKTTDVYVYGVAGFFAFLVREDLRPDLPLEKLRVRLSHLLGRRPVRLPRVPPEEVVDGIAAAARAPSRARRQPELVRLRNVALVETLVGSGLRVSELVALRRADLARGDGSAVVTGKGGKDRVVFFSPASTEAIGAYLGARGEDGTAAPLFARHDDPAGPRPLTTGGVRWVLAGLGRAAGVADAGVTPHRLRAYFATRVLARTGDLAATQDLLGHASPSTTRLYARLTDRRLREQHARAFPDAGYPPAAASAHG